MDRTGVAPVGRHARRLQSTGMIGGNTKRRGQACTGDYVAQITGAVGDGRVDVDEEVLAIIDAPRHALGCDVE